MTIGLHICHADGESAWLEAPSPVLIGRAEDCQVRVRHWRVARYHARLTAHEGRVALEDLGSLLGTLVNGRRVAQCAAVLADDEIMIGGTTLRVVCRQGAAGERGPETRGGGQSSLHLSDSLAANLVEPDQGSMAQTLAHSYELEPDPVPGAIREAIPEAAAGLPHRIGPDSMTPEPDLTATRFEHAAQIRLWRQRLQQRLVEAMDLRRRDVAGMSDAMLRAEAGRLLHELIDAATNELPETADKASLHRDVLDEVVGLGPLERLLADPEVSEIMVNRYDEVFVERAGRLCRHDVSFSSEKAVLAILERIVAPLGRRVDEASPMVDARLPDGSRVNAVIAPIALKGASITIRKFPERRLELRDLLARGTLDEAMARVLQCCVQERCNIVVSGGTGSGKTTLLNVLSGFIPAGERIVTIEDAAELRLQHEHLVSLEARPANLEGRGVVTIRDLVRNALRMRPDRIVVGECRGAEALDMLQAMNTGHEGSMTTLHANTPRDALARLETMVLMAGVDLPLTAVREQIAGSIDVIVQQARSTDGARRIMNIVEVAGMESGRIQLQEWFRFEPGRSDSVGEFVGAGVLPSQLEVWQARGVDLPREFFYGRTPVKASVMQAAVAPSTPSAFASARTSPVATIEPPASAEWVDTDMPGLIGSGRSGAVRRSAQSFSPSAWSGGS